MNNDIKRFHRKHHINFDELQGLTTQSHEQGKLRHIKKLKDHYVVYHNHTHYGIYRTLNEALYERDDLERHKWNYSQWKQSQKIRSDA